MDDVLKKALIQIRDMEQKFHPKLHRVFNEMACCADCIKHSTPCDIHDAMFTEIRVYCEQQERILHVRMRKVAVQALAQCESSSGKK